MIWSPVLRLTLLLALCLPIVPARAEAPALALPPPGVSVIEAPLRIVVVHWKIKPGREAEFLDYWSTRSVVEDRTGLIGEYLSSIEDRARAPWINWGTLDPAYVSYFNVGLWQDVDSFQSQIGKFIDNTRPPLPFEAAKRERIFLVPERWRAGKSALPMTDPPSVR